MSVMKKGKPIGPMSEDAKHNHSLSLMGHAPWGPAHHTPEARARMSIIHRGPLGSNWKGGLTSENDTVRRNVEYDTWRAAVYARDDYTCPICGKHGVDLEAHHIQNFAAHKDERLDVANGVTMCAPCHKRFHLIFGQKDNTLQELQTFVMIQEA